MESASIWTIVITAAVTAVVSITSALIGGYSNYRLGLSKDKQLRNDELDRHARYLAIRVVCKLDPFVSQCCEVVDDNGVEDQKGETHPMVESPTISFPDDVDWRSVPPDLMYRILGFPNELENARQYVSFIANDISFPPDHSEFFEARAIQYGQLGLTALALADEIRKTFEIPKQDYGNRDPKITLERAVKEAMKAQEATRVSQDKLMSEIAAKAGLTRAANPPPAA